ncbi:MAG: methyltransferase domain-containing protein [Nitrososphaerales archaeon]
MQVAQKIAAVNLGCPFFCKNWICVDLYPKTDNVIKQDVYNFLNTCETDSIGLIKSENLLEHLDDMGVFLRQCYRILAPGGKLIVKTDNALFLPFYFPFSSSALGLGIGAHSDNKYALRMNHSLHLHIFTKVHLRNLFQNIGFSSINVRFDKKTLGARLIAEGYKVC